MEIAKQLILKEIKRIRKFKLTDNPKEVKDIWDCGLNFALDEMDRFVRNLTK